MFWDQGFKDKHLSHHFLFHSPFGFNGHKFTYHLLFYQYHLHLITSYFTSPLASMDTNSLITCISSLLISPPLWHQWTKRLLIIILLNGIVNLWVLFAWNQFPPLLIDLRECYPCPTYFLNDPWSFNDD
jgi:hypothetical protein